MTLPIKDVMIFSKGSFRIFTSTLFLEMFLDPKLLMLQAESRKVAKWKVPKNFLENSQDSWDCYIFSYELIP